jgi:DnaK suppressor protein
VTERAKFKKNADLKRRLKAQLDFTVTRLQKQGEVPQGSAASGDFLDVAQSVEHQELAWLGASRLAEQAQRLRIALSRVADGEYGVCVECGSAIPPKRLLAVPDATTCVACQERLEHVGGMANSPRHPEAA